MKKRVFALLCIVFVCFSIFLVGCQRGGNSVDGEPNYDEPIDPNRTQLYVGNYNGGLGARWLWEVKELFEKAHPEIQVKIDNDTTGYESTYLDANIATNRQDLYFLDSNPYYTFVLPMLSQIHIDGISSFGNAMFLIFMIVGGAMVIPAGMNIFARLFGQADDLHGGGSFLRSVYYGSRFASLAAFGLAGGILRTGYRGTRGIVRKIRIKKSSGSGGDSGGTADGGDKYTETPAAAESETETGGSGESGQ